eukprot:Rmarinus@m.16075
MPGCSPFPPPPPHRLGKRPLLPNPALALFEPPQPKQVRSPIPMYRPHSYDNVESIVKKIYNAHPSSGSGHSSTVQRRCLPKMDQWKTGTITRQAGTRTHHAATGLRSLKASSQLRLSPTTPPPAALCKEADASPPNEAIAGAATGGGAKNASSGTSLLPAEQKPSTSSVAPVHDPRNQDFVVELLDVDVEAATTFVRDDDGGGKHVVSTKSSAPREGTSPEGTHVYDPQQQAAELKRGTGETQGMDSGVDDSGDDDEVNVGGKGGGKKRKIKKRRKKKLKKAKPVNELTKLRRKGLKGIELFRWVVRNRVMKEKDIMHQLRLWKKQFLDKNALLIVNGERIKKGVFDKICAHAGADEDDVRKLAFTYQSITGSVFWKMSYNTFENMMDEILDVETSDFMMRRLWYLFGGTSDSDITFFDYARGMHMLATPTQKSRVTFLFHLVDFDGGGSIDVKEIMDVFFCDLTDMMELTNCMNAVMTVLDEDNSGDITLEEFYNASKEVPLLFDCLSKRVPSLKASKYTGTSYDITFEDLQNIISYMEGMNEIDSSVFNTVMATFFHVEQKPLTNYMFHVFDDDGGGTISLRELLVGLSHCSASSRKKQFSFVQVDTFCKFVPKQSAITYEEFTELSKHLELHNEEEIRTLFDTVLQLEKKESTTVSLRHVIRVLYKRSVLVFYSYNSFGSYLQNLRHSL